MEGSKLGGLWKVPSLVVNGEASCLVANGRFQCLMALGRFQAWWLLEGKGEASFSPFFIFPVTNFTWTFFPLILRFYFTMVLDRYFTPFLDFSWLINCNHTFWCTKSSTHSFPSWSKIEDFFPFLEFMALRMTMSYEP